MKIKNLFNQKKQTFSFEVFPPKKDSPKESITKTFDALCALKPDYISVTYGAGGSNAGEGTLSLSIEILHKYGITPLPHLTCISTSKDEVMSLITKFKENGIENVFALRGDANPNAPAKNDFKYANELVSYLKPHGFNITGACYPEGHIAAPSLVQDLIYLKQKVDCGTEHLISQLFFDNDLFLRFLDKAKKQGIFVPIEAGIMPVTNKNQIERMVTLCGASIPARLSKILSRYENDPNSLFDAGIEYACMQIDGLLDAGVDGIHLYTMNNPMVARKICEGIRNII